MEEPVRVKERTMRCPSCGGLNAADAAWCGQCLTRFVEPSPPVDDVEPVEEVEPSAAAEEFDSVEEAGPESARVPGVSDGLASEISETPAPAVDKPVIPKPAPEAVGTKRGAFRVTEEGIDWTCRVCDSENPMELPSCRICGADFAATLRPPEQERPERDPNLTALVSLFMPGAGHIYLGLWPQGIARVVVQLWVVSAALIGAVQKSAAIWITFGLAAIVLWAVSAHDAYREAADGGRGVLLAGRAFLWLVLGLLGLLLLVVVMTAMTGPSRVAQ